MRLEISATVVLYRDGIAICEDGYGTLWYTEIPKEYAEIGTAIDTQDLKEVSELPISIQKEIKEAINQIPKDVLDEMRGAPEVNV